MANAVPLNTIFPYLIHRANKKEMMMLLISTSKRYLLGIFFLIISTNFPILYYNIALLGNEYAYTYQQ